MTRHENTAPYTGEYHPSAGANPQMVQEWNSFSPSVTNATSPASTASPTLGVKQHVPDVYDISTAPQRKPTSMASSVRTEKEKRKRSRVTTEQLAELERYFAMDRNPSVARRKEISEQLGMQERQTQIWFQNRRAKAKLQEGKNSSRGETAETSPERQPSEVPPVPEIDVQNLIHEDEPVRIIPCSDLSIGSWRRIATSSASQDLIAYVSHAKRCLNWFIRSGGYGFKMEIPFDSITNARLTNAGPESSMAAFVLSRAPNFYLEDIASTPCDGLRHTWKRCSDWTEGHQASKVLRHTLVGSSTELAQIIESFSPRTHVPLRLPASRPPSLPPLEIPSLEGTPDHVPLYGVANTHLSRSWQSQNPLPYNSAANTQFIGRQAPRSPPHSAPAISSQQMSTQHRGSVSAGFEPRAHNTYQPTSHPLSSVVTFHNGPVSQSPIIHPYAAQSQLYANSYRDGSDSRSDIVNPSLPHSRGYTISHSSLTPSQYQYPAIVNIPTNINQDAEVPQAGAEQRLMPRMPGSMYEMDRHRGRV